jgi:hypothetical protein
MDKARFDEIQWKLSPKSSSSSAKKGTTDVMTLRMPKTLYLVQRIRWAVLEDSPTPRYVCPDAERGSPERSFEDHDEAEECRAALERAYRAEVNPFAYCETIEDLTHFDADRLHDWILDAGLEPPHSNNAPVRIQWHAWWEEQFPKMSELQRAKMWQAMPKLQFYRVIELHAAGHW